MLYNPPTGGAANDPYVGANIAAGIQGSKVPPGAVEFPQRELVSLITAAGLAPTNTDLQQATRAVRSGILEYALDAGTVNAPAVTPSPAHTQLVDGLHVRVRMKAAPTGPTTFSISSLVAPVEYLGGGALIGGDWAANDVVDFVYSAARNAFQLLGLTISQDDAADAASSLLLKATDTSTAANTITAKGENRTLTAYQDGLQVEINPQFANTGATTIAIDTAPTVPILRNDATALQPRDIGGGASLLTLVYAANLTAFQIDGFAGSQVVRQLPVGASTTLWVRADGNDANNGSANTPAAAFATIKAAIVYALSRFSLGAGTVTIQLGIPGTYAPPGFVPPVVGTLAIVGDTTGTNQAGYVISGPGPAAGYGVAALLFFQGGTISLSGITIANTGNNNYSLIAGATFITIQNVTFSASTGSNKFAFLSPGNGGSISDVGGCIYSGAMGYLAAAVDGYVTFAANPTLSNNPVFSIATAFASICGAIFLNPGVTFNGSATGQRYHASYNGVIQTFGAGANAFPGSSAGSTDTGGQYA